VIRLTFLVAALLTMLTWDCLAAVGNEPYTEVTTSYELEVTPLYFGTHFHYLVSNSRTNVPLTKWPAPLIGSVRLWDSMTRWADILPSAGHWHFEHMDAYVEQAAMHHAAILYTLGSTPRWASARPEENCPYGKGCSAEPVRMAHWEEYVRRVAQRYKGKISAYELWNEPFFSDFKNQKGESDFFYGPVSKMVEMAGIARKVLNEVDPHAVLATPGFTGPTNQLELFLSSGGKKYVQAVAYHFYSTNSDQFVKQVLEVRAIMKRQGLENLPLWNTETGLEVYPADQPLPPGAKRWTASEAGILMAQFLVLGAEAGLERFYYYAWDNLFSGMLTPSGGHLPAWDAYEKVESWLLNAKMLGCEAFQSDGVRCQGERAGQRFLIVWAKKEGIVNIPVPSGQRVVSIENLYAYIPVPVTAQDRVLKITLGMEPKRILLEPKP
jgi:hypothetical protein